MLLVAAVLSLGISAANAQSNVTIYGVADVGYAYQNNTSGQHINQLFSNGLSDSRLGLKGTEDLGNGNAVFFTLEQSVNFDSADQSNPSTFSARQTYLGFKNSTYGSISGGLQYSPGYIASTQYDAIYGSQFSASQVLAGMGGMTIANNANGRWNNSLTYYSPTVYGFNGQLMYRLGDQVSSTSTSSGSSQSGYGVGLNYTWKDLNVGYVYQASESSASGSNQTAVNSPAVQRENFLGASYDFKVVKLVGQYQWSNWSATGAGNASNQLWAIGAIVPVTSAFSITSNYGQLIVDNHDSHNTNGTAQSYSLGGIYSLSKRTRIYGLFNYTTVDNDMMVMGYNGLSSPATSSNTLISSASNGYTYALGMNHSF